MSAGICCPSTSARKPETPRRPASWSERAAMSNSAQAASRSRLRPPTGLPAERGLPAQALRPARTGPQHPQRLLRRRALRNRHRTAGEQVGQPGRRVDLRSGLEVLEQIGMPDGGRHQITGEPRQTRPRQFGPVGLAQAAPETPQSHAVQAAQGRGQQHPRLVGIRAAAAEGDLQAEQERADGGFPGEGNLVAGHLDRDLGGRQRPAQPRDHPFAGPHQHGHLGPVQPVAQVRLPKQFGDLLGLGPRRGTGQRLHPAPAEARGRAGLAERRHDRRRQGPRQTQPVGDVAARRQQGGSEASRRGQGDDRRGRPG